MSALLFCALWCCVQAIHQMHISYWGEKSRSISWTSMEQKTPMKLAYRLAGTPNGKPLKVVESNVTIWSEPQVKDDYRFIHQVVLTDLKFEKYLYYLMDEGPSYEFEVFDNSAEKFHNFLVYGDLGQENSKCLPAIEKYASENKVDLVLHVGDMCYDMYENNGTHTDIWMNQIERLASKIPYMVIPGNHESKFNFTHYEGRYRSVSGTNPYFYSYDYGMVHVIHFNTEVYFYPEFYKEEDIARQFEFLKNDLAAANKNRHNVPWLITNAHRPMYCQIKSFHCIDEGDPIRVGKYGLEKMFYENKVDVEIWGHVHNYGRTFPLYNELWQQTALDVYADPIYPVHVITGAAGNREKVAHSASIQDFTAAHIEKYSFSTFNFTQEELTIQQWDDGVDKPVLLDQFKITKTKKWWNEVFDRTN